MLFIENCLNFFSCLIKFGSIIMIDDLLSFKSFPVSRWSWISLFNFGCFFLIWFRYFGWSVFFINSSFFVFPPVIVVFFIFFRLSTSWPSFYVFDRHDRLLLVSALSFGFQLDVVFFEVFMLYIYPFFHRLFHLLVYLTFSRCLINCGIFRKIFLVMFNFHVLCLLCIDWCYGHLLFLS